MWEPHHSRSKAKRLPTAHVAHLCLSGGQPRKEVHFGKAQRKCILHYSSATDQTFLDTQVWELSHLATQPTSTELPASVTTSDVLFRPEGAQAVLQRHGLLPVPSRFTPQDGGTNLDRHRETLTMIINQAAHKNASLCKAYTLERGNNCVS